MARTPIQNLAARVYGVTFLVLIAGVTSYAVLQVRQEERIYRELVLSSAGALVGIMTGSVAHALVVEDYAAVDEALEQAASLPGILRLQVCEPDGSLVSDVRREGARTVVEVTPSSDHLQVPATPEATARELEGGDALEVWHRITVGRPIGWVRAILDQRPIRNIVREQVQRAALLSAILVTVCFSLLFWAFRAPVEAVRRLAEFARDLDRRKGQQVPVPGVARELDLLAESLNAASVELARSEQRLRAERERLSVTLGSLGEAVFATDLEGRLGLMNRAAEELSGVTLAEALGRPVGALLRSPPGEDGAGARLQSLAAHPAAGYEEAFRIAGQDGAPRTVAAAASPILGAAGETLGAVLVVRDLTERERLAAERRSLEAQLLQSQKMEALGHMAGGVAHDFNNILTAIIGYAKLAAGSVEPEAPVQEDLEQILVASERAAGLTKSLLAFSRKQAIELIPVDLNVIVRDMEKILRRLVGEDVTIRLELADGPLVVVADRGQVSQILVNLAANARDAMPRGGALMLTTGRDEAPSAAAWTGRQVPARVCWFAAADTGTGMDEEVRRRAFEPFFTTKPVGKGSGLGLAIVHGIVIQHGGAVELESRPGAGTRLRVSFPASDLPLPAPSERPARRSALGHGTVLLVEDDALVSRVVRVTLEEAGYQVLTAEHGVRGLELLVQPGPKVDLLLSDVIMPEMNGAELAAAARRRFPGLPVLLMSGYTADVLERSGTSLDGVEIMAKPLQPARLLERVRELIAGGR